MLEISQSPTPLEVLRSVTRSHHRGLEERLPLARAEAGLPEYLDYARALLGWLEPLEAELWQGSWPEAVDVPLRRGKADWLRADLTAGGWSAAEVAWLPRCRSGLPAADPIQRWGIAYVVEGSQLGGQVLRRRLQARLGAVPGRYLDGYGDQTGPRWRALVTELNRALGPTDAARAAGAAVQTFASLADWLRAHGAAS